MYNIVFKKKINSQYINHFYTDDYYSDTIDVGLSVLQTLDKCELISIGYVYKYLGMFWKIGPCVLSHGQYKTLKQLSLGWFTS